MLLLVVSSDVIKILDKIVMTSAMTLKTIS